MEFSLFIPLMVAAIQSAGQVLSSFVSRAKDTASNYIFDKDFFEDTIVESSEQLANLINIASINLKQEIRKQSIMDAMQELQAHIASMEDLLNFVNTSEITPAMAERLITGGLLPLQVSLKKAEIRLSQYGNDDMRLFCHVVGTKTLIAGYIYAGQNVPALQKDLEDSIYVFQKRLLDAIAQSKREIPWNKVPHLLTTDGISDLFELYNSTLQDEEKSHLVENLLIKPEDTSRKQKTSSTTKNRKVRDMKLQDVTETAQIKHGFLNLSLSCSECGFYGFSQNTTICPNCQRKFI